MELRNAGGQPYCDLHVGDNPVADCDQAEPLGIKTFHYKNDPIQSDRAQFEQMCSGDYQFMFDDLLKISTTHGDKGVLTIPLAGFVLQIIEEAISEGVETAYFFTREGVFFKELYNIAVESDVFYLGEYPKSEILSISRMATYAASLDSVSLSSLTTIWSQYSTQSLNALFKSLAFDPTVVKEQIEKAELTLEEVIQYPWLDKRMKRLFDQQEFTDVLNKHVAQRRDDLRKYLDEAGFSTQPEAKRLIADIGWRGTIQDNVARWSKNQIIGVYLGLEKFLNPQPLNTKKHGFLMNKNIAEDFHISEVAALEFLCNSLGGSVTGYQEGFAVRKIVDDEEAIILDHVLDIQNAIKECFADVIYYIKHAGLISADLRDLSRRIICSYIQYKTFEWENDRFVNMVSFVLQGIDVMTNTGIKPSYTDEPFIAKSKHSEIENKFVAWQKRLAYMS